MDEKSSMQAGSPSQQLEEELTIPRAAVNKYIKEICPNARLGLDTRELLLQSCTEFIHVITTEAHNVCNQTQKKTITASHILAAMKNLGFDDYVAEAETVLIDCKALAAKKRRKCSRLENLGIPEEDLLRQQQELFAKARQEMEAANQQQWLHMQQQNIPPPTSSSDEEE